MILSTDIYHGTRDAIVKLHVLHERNLEYHNSLSAMLTMIKLLIVYTGPN